ncbi:MAG: hypothetical protein HN995_11020 [Candidatus Marinimicrobia bacterium]|jgi:uncharacterized protein involved in exopolysaccharide biosynthesis|nr:hypothetical protein [Candidatus Neomarinimicrobiota bacterium]MBT6556579.1 hypothetical protein [Candidatus Neomarinimicrobiota bacterium]MBT6947708.1 hypothetical protein [Candidatus Neomarinimicrobiota bacterium]
MSSNVNTSNGDLKGLILLFWDYRKFIIGITSFAAITSVIVSLVLPVAYRATAIILPPTVDGGGMGIASLLSGLPFGGMGMDGMGQATNNYLSILNSRTMGERVLKEFDLMAEYESEFIEEALDALAGNSKFVLHDEGTLAITVFDGDQDRVAHITNYFVQQLDSINKELTKERAGNNRSFIEKRLTQVYAEAAVAENKLKLFQEENGAYSLEVQAEESIRALASIEADIIKKEIELDVMQISMNSDHPEVLFLKKEISTLNASLDNLIMASENDRILKSPGNLPALVVEYARLLRDVTAKNAVLEFLIPEYEQARIQEVRDTPTVQVLDHAQRPSKKSKPFRALIVMLSTMSGFFGSLYFILFRKKYWHLT